MLWLQRNGSLGSDGGWVMGYDFNPYQCPICKSRRLCGNCTSVTGNEVEHYQECWDCRSTWTIIWEPIDIKIRTQTRSCKTDDTPT